LAQGSFVIAFRKKLVPLDDRSIRIMHALISPRQLPLNNAGNGASCSTRARMESRAAESHG
jgi:hypothetical protein